jgi:CBS domain containing-hemolysin-like protein
MTALLLLAVVVLVLLNGFFVAAEFALVRVRRSRMEEQTEEGRRGAGMVLRQLDDLSRYLAACQLGITFTSLGIGFLGEPAVADIIEGRLGDGVPHGVSLTISLGLAYLITTSLHITIGEQVPKIYAINRAETVARWIAGPLHLFTQAFSPFIHLLNGASNAVLRLLGIRKTDEFDEGGSPEELKVLIAQSLTGGKLDPGEAGMLSGVFHLHEQEARQVMTPAPAIVTVDLDANVTSWNPAAESLFGYTREEALGRNVDDLVALPDQRQEAEAYSAAAASGSPVWRLRAERLASASRMVRRASTSTASPSCSHR